MQRFKIEGVCKYRYIGWIKNCVDGEDFAKKHKHPQLNVSYDSNNEEFKEIYKIPNNILKNVTKKLCMMSITSTPIVNADYVEGECIDETLFLGKDPYKDNKFSHLVKNDTWHIEGCELTTRPKNFNLLHENIINDENIFKQVSEVIEKSILISKSNLEGIKLCFCNKCNYCTNIINTPEGIVFKRTLNDVIEYKTGIRLD